MRFFAGLKDCVVAMSAVCACSLAVGAFSVDRCDWMSFPRSGTCSSLSSFVHCD